MKYNLDNKTNRFAQRTLVDFSNGLLQLACKKKFENVTVQELCDTCNYPRATFYNYFEDIYDLLDYCWLATAKELKLEEYQSIAPEERLYVIFEQTFDLLTLKKIS